MKRIFLASALAISSIAFARVGPVSEYGQLFTGTNSSGEGRIYGSCQGKVDGAEVQIRGMSLYWSLLPDALEFWNAEAIKTLVDQMNIQVIRASMATGTEQWYPGYSGYEISPEMQKNLVNTVVQAAIDNDIYVIIDWHSHTATEQTESSVGFFTEMAKKWGNYDNVIFELFNEPTTQKWSEIKAYADTVVSAIRQYSDNLILVGNRSWDQYPNEAIGNEVKDPKSNTAYTLHYYAATHNYEGNSSEGEHTVQAIKAGLSIFVSEWGTGTADGSGSEFSSKNAGWQAFMDKYKLSWANWSASKVSEFSAAFTPSATSTSLSFTTSGDSVKKYLSSNPTSYKACSDSPTSIQNFRIADASKAISTNIFGNLVEYILPAKGLTRIELIDVLGHAKTLVLENKKPGTYSLKLDGIKAGRYFVRISQKELSKILNINITK